MTYKEDRTFTEYIHNIALEKIYKFLGWIEIEINSELSKKIDIEQGIDRIFKTKEGNIITVQERFRTIKYQEYNDFTIRYTRNQSLYDERKQSEFFKIKADYFVYGITNCKSNTDRNCNNFCKFAVINVKTLKKMLQNGSIIVDENFQHKKSLLKEEGKLIVPILKNIDSSSEFIAIDIPSLKALDQNIIILQRGFYV